MSDPSTMLGFLQAILPSTGRYCAMTIIDGNASHHFRDTPEALADYLQKTDGSLSTGAVYHACASFNGKSRRRQANVVSVRSLWLDVDAGPGKPYLDAREASAAARTFAVRVGAPPIVVGSGGGLHLYWPFAEDVTPAEWLQHARTLRRLCDEFGFRADSSRTCDSASTLRPPGTVNRKYDNG